jgi:hypothetical protein
MKFFALLLLAVAVSARPQGDIKPEVDPVPLGENPAPAIQEQSETPDDDTSKPESRRFTKRQEQTQAEEIPAPLVAVAQPEISQADPDDAPPEQAEDKPASRRFKRQNREDADSVKEQAEDADATNENADADQAAIPAPAANPAASKFNRRQIAAEEAPAEDAPAEIDTEADNTDNAEDTQVSQVNQGKISKRQTQPQTDVKPVDDLPTEEGAELAAEAAQESNNDDTPARPATVSQGTRITKRQVDLKPQNVQVENPQIVEQEADADANADKPAPSQVPVTLPEKINKRQVQVQQGEDEENAEAVDERPAVEGDQENVEDARPVKPAVVGNRERRQVRQDKPIAQEESQSFDADSQQTADQNAQNPDVVAPASEERTKYARQFVNPPVVSQPEIQQQGEQQSNAGEEQANNNNNEQQQEQEN